MHSLNSFHRRQDALAVEIAAREITAQCLRLVDQIQEFAIFRGSPPPFKLSRKSGTGATRDNAPLRYPVQDFPLPGSKRTSSPFPVADRPSASGILPRQLRQGHRSPKQTPPSEHGSDVAAQPAQLPPLFLRAERIIGDRLNLGANSSHDTVPLLRGSVLGTAHRRSYLRCVCGGLPYPAGSRGPWRDAVTPNFRQLNEATSIFRFISIEQEKSPSRCHSTRGGRISHFRLDPVRLWSTRSGRSLARCPRNVPVALDQ